MKKIKLNINQRRAISDLFINLSNSFITVGFIAPIFTKDYQVSFSIIGIIFSFSFSATLVFISNSLLK